VIAGPVLDERRGVVGRRLQASERDATSATRQPLPPPRCEPFLSPPHHPDCIYANHAPGYSIGLRPQAAAVAAKHAAVILPLLRVTRALRAHPRPGIIFPIPLFPSRRLSNTATVTSLSLLHNPHHNPSLARSTQPPTLVIPRSTVRVGRAGKKLYFYIF